MTTIRLTQEMVNCLAEMDRLGYFQLWENARQSWRYGRNVTVSATALQGTGLRELIVSANKSITRGK